MLEELDAFHIIFDEYQSLFDESMIDILPILNKASSFVGTSGSPSEPEHINILLSYVPKALYV